ncbi:MAG: sulfurtransferase-like selenium metabolism protein YedF [Desulfuromonadales bacterium]|nr:sulfurtransferase-like selenium metabolism protein YedF [Desulfuromonadales bacterium]
MLELDYRGYACPYPVVETRKQILANTGRKLMVLVDDDVCRDNVTRLAQKMGYQTSAAATADGYRLALTPLEMPAEAPAPAPQTTAAGATVIYCGSDRMGSGDDAFGRLLLKNFLMIQLEIDPLPAAILFVNSGIHLVCAGSEVLDTLVALKTAGVDIASCGLCLDFYHRKDQLKVGRITNMLDIVDIQHRAGRIISP